LLIEPSAFASTVLNSGNGMLVPGAVATRSDDWDGYDEDELCSGIEDEDCSEPEAGDVVVLLLGYEDDDDELELLGYWLEDDELLLGWLDVEDPELMLPFWSLSEDP
jgi:hypothetical protein